MNATDIQKHLTQNKINFQRTCNTIFEMLKDRGYTQFLKIEDHDSMATSNVVFTTNEFRKITSIDNLKTLSLLSQNIKTKEKIYVLFYDQSIGIKTINEEILKYMKDNSISRAIVITVFSGKLTPAAQKEIQKLKPTYIIEHFFGVELMENISKHKLVPKHTIISKKKQKFLLKEYNCKQKNFPQIPRTDPMAKFLGLQPGQMVRVDRTSETAGKYVTYRLCV